ncbi:MAG: methionyl-tRNA formyltransferase [Hyphomicrobiaceae bacterium]
MLRIVFMGTPDFAVPTLAEILAAGHDVVAVYAQPPRRAGRGMEATKSPVHQYAEGAGLQVFTPTTLKTDESRDVFRAHAADVAVVVAYGLILPTDILEAPRNGCLNLHASKLPRWRGAAPIQRAIMAGDTETAAMVMRMDAGLDTGPVCLGENVPIGPNATAGELHDVLAQCGASLVVRALAALERGSLEATAQSDEGVTYASKIKKSEARIDFARSAGEVHNHIRGLSPFPGAWFEISGAGSSERIKVLRSEVMDAAASAEPGTILTEDLQIACSAGRIRLVEVQRAGKRPMSASELLRGFAIPVGARANS